MAGCALQPRPEALRRRARAAPHPRVASHYIVSNAQLNGLEGRGRRLRRSDVRGVGLTRGYWLLDILHLVLQQHGHVSSLLPLLQEQKRRVAEQRRENRSLPRLKGAMKAEGVLWSRGRWSETNEWSLAGVRVSWKSSVASLSALSSPLSGFRVSASHSDLKGRP